MADEDAAFRRSAVVYDFAASKNRSQDDIVRAYENLANAVIADAVIEYLQKRQTIVTLERNGGWKADERYLDTLIAEARRIGSAAHKKGIKDGIILRTVRSEALYLEKWLFEGGCDWLNPGVDMQVIRDAVNEKVRAYQKDRSSWAYSLHEDGRGHHRNRARGKETENVGN